MSGVRVKQVIGAAVLAAGALVAVGVSSPALASASASGPVSGSVSFLGYDCGGGITMTVPQIPAGFDPLTATADQLQAYGYPARPPAGTALYAAWQTMVSGPINWGGAQSCPASAAAAPATSVAGARAVARPRLVHGGVSSLNWSGYIANQGAYTDAETYIEMPASVSGGSSTVAAMWAGVNVTGNSTYPILQTGLDIWGDGLFRPWCEAAPGGTYYFPMTVSPGDILFAHATLGSNGQGACHLVDVTQSVDLRYAMNPGGTIDGHAEFIVERPYAGSPPNCYHLPLANYGTPGAGEYFTAQVAAGGAWKLIGSAPHGYQYMHDAAGTLASPGAIDSSGDFLNQFIRAGNRDPAPCS